jgi:hypothetical protein
MRGTEFVVNELASRTERSGSCIIHMSAAMHNVLQRNE